MILPIRLYGDPVLRRRAQRITDFAPIPTLARDMLETMHDASGVGLAAPQVGVSQRLFVFAEFEDEEPEEGSDEPRSRVMREHIVANPVVTILDNNTVLGTEGCLSMPNLYEEDVPRMLALRLDYQDENGTPKSAIFKDYLARVVQHEHDHLEGKLFFDLLAPERLQQHREELLGMQRQAKTFLKELEATQKLAQKSKQQANKKPSASKRR